MAPRHYKKATTTVLAFFFILFGVSHSAMGSVPAEEAMRRKTSLEELKMDLREFANERDWDQFHTPKNLAMALIVETGELVERFQWLTPEEGFAVSEEEKETISEEVADILIYLTRFCDVMDIDLLECAFQKVSKNAQKYPKDLAKGAAKKSTDLLRREEGSQV
jgi:NTP pyrophosphatase (non-canonical NTP hydrolase)